MPARPRAADDFGAIRDRMAELRRERAAPAAAEPLPIDSGRGNVLLGRIGAHSKDAGGRRACGGLVEQWIAPECNGACMG